MDSGAGLQSASRRMKGKNRLEWEGGARISITKVYHT